ncbi:hypothetical protein PPTG_22340 [Phytophthora nicotianae INRA-310]|uniref:Uncharacterized protein n=1 Tax=Phytophthora nicotianae (strain INRA-310) TaxID=761204 RepID=W2QJP0_PHYN3|nr:hypothetical protein PPTG_22340 [Phytophthora nicotianae INRA-310]ETN13348.1 hypothetical protein PPTG_22340 [Phytophthora nicotianae INRA-310]
MKEYERIEWLSGPKQLSEAKILHIEKDVAFHLGELQRGFADGSLDENEIENIDETHFIVDFDNGKTLGSSGDKTVKYADVVSGDEGMAMVVRLSGGPSARYFPPTDLCQPADSFVISKIKDAWKVKWNEKKTELTKASCWQNKIKKDALK